MALSLPPPIQPAVDREGRLTEPWYRFFNQQANEVNMLRIQVDGLIRLNENRGAYDMDGIATVTFVGTTI